MHGNGQTEATTRGDVADGERAAEEPRASVLPALEPCTGRGGLRSFRGEAVRAVLRGSSRSAERAAWALLSAGAAGILRGFGLGAGDGVASCGLVGGAKLSESGSG